MATTTLQLLYPYRGHIAEAKVLSWGFDAKVNAAVDEHVAQCGVFPDDDSGAYEVFVASITAPTLEDSIAILEDLGLATFARWSDDDGDEE